MPQNKQNDPYAALPDVQESNDPYAALPDVQPKENAPKAQGRPGVKYVRPATVGSVAAGFPGFAKQVKEAAGKDISSAWQGLKSGVSEGAKTLRRDPTSIVPMWFGGLMSGLEAGGKAVSTPIEYAAHGKEFNAISSAAGGDPEAANKYRSEGNYGGEFWEMIGKPVALLAMGKAASAVGGAVSEGAQMPQLRIVRGFMSDAGTSSRAGISIDDARLAEQALQDAARAEYGTGRAGERGVKGALPSREKGLKNVLSPGPATASRVEAGNKELIRLSKNAVDLAGKPADKANMIFGYMDGRKSAEAIRLNLLNKARDAKAQGLESYSNALKARAASMEGKKTLGQIYEVKKAANKLADVARTTQEAIDLMDSWTELASSIRQEVYPIYEKHIGGAAPGFSISQAGRKEGAAMQFRNGLEKRYALAQKATDELHIPGKTSQQLAHGASGRRAFAGMIARKAQESGLFASPQGDINKAGARAIGRLSPKTVPETLSVASGAKFGAVPPSSQKLLPGGTFKFKIPGVPTTEGAKGSMSHRAARAPGHDFEQPRYTTSSAPVEPRPGYAGTSGAEISTGRVPEVKRDVSKGGAVIETSDPKMAQDALDRMEIQLRRYDRIGATFQEKTRLKKAIADLKQQLKDYQGGIGKGQISHTPAKMEYKARKTGKIPVHHPVRQYAPSAISAWERDRYDEDQPAVATGGSVGNEEPPEE